MLVLAVTWAFGRVPAGRGGSPAVVVTPTASTTITTLVRAWLGRRELLQTHGLRATRLMDDKRAHDAGFSHSPAQRQTSPSMPLMGS
jgi:hypothetical protein